MNIPLGKPFVGDEEREAVAKVLNSRLLATGSTVREFESAFAERFQRRYCIAVSSGSVALYLGLKALGVKRVIIPALTCEAVINAALNAGMSIFFADVEPETHNLDMSTLSESQLGNAEAVIVTHTYGHAAEMDKLDFYIKKYKLVLIEDFAQATGGYFRDRMLSSFGRVAITSLYASKGITTGHGGILLTDDEELYLKCVYGRGSRTTTSFSDLIPLNLQMTDIQAAIGLVQLTKLDKMVEMRRNVAALYFQELEAVPIGLIHEKSWAKHAYFKYAIVLPQNVQKQAFIEKMGVFGIETGKLYDPPLHKSEIAQNVLENTAKLPISEDFASRTVSLPMFPELSSEDIIRVCETISSIINVQSKT